MSQREVGTTDLPAKRCTGSVGRGVPVGGTARTTRRARLYGVPMMMLLFSARTIIALSLVNGIIILLSSRCASASVTLPNAFLHCLTTVSIRSTPLPPSPLLPWPWCHRATTKTIVVSSTPSSRKNDVYIAFPGGGLFFYWQAGVIVSVYCVPTTNITTHSFLQK